MVGSSGYFSSRVKNFKIIPPYYLAITYFACLCLAFVLPIGRNLEYETSLILTISFIFFIPISFAIALRKSPGFNKNIIFIYGFFLYPGVYQFFFSTNLCPCSSLGGHFWYIFNALPAWFLAHDLGFFYQRLKSQKHIFIIHFFLVFFFLLSTVSILWLTPQKRLLSFVFGFLHGPVYDDSIELDEYIVLLRMCELALFVLVFYFLKSGKEITAKKMLFLTAVFLSALFISSFSPSLGHGAFLLRNKLNQVYNGDGFALYYNEDSFKDSDYSPSEFSLDIKFHISELRLAFGVQTLPKVDIYVYPTTRAKKLWFGGGGTDITDVRGPSIHVIAHRWPHESLRHELVHALASDIAFFGLGFHPNMLLTEGLAEAFAPSSYEENLHEQSAVLVQHGRMPNLESMLSPLFWLESSARAYTVAGSFILFLQNKYSTDSVLKWYGGASFSSVFAISSKEAINNYLEFIKSLYGDPEAKIYAEKLFRSAGIFSDRCPHSRADLALVDNDFSFLQFRQPLFWKTKKDYPLWLEKLTGGKEARDDILKREATNMMRRNYSIDEVTNFTQKIELKTKPKTIEDINILLLQGDLLQGIQSPKASSVLKDLETYAENLQLGSSLNRQIAARAMVNKLPEIKRQDWFLYLAGFKAMPKDNEAWIERYLRLFRSVEYGNPKNVLLDDMGKDSCDSQQIDLCQKWFELRNRIYLVHKKYDLANTVSTMRAVGIPESPDHLQHILARLTKYYQEAAK